MEMEMEILNPFSPLLLIAIGIILAAIEALFFSFVFLWFGIATILVGILSYIYIFSDGIWQIIDISIVAIFMLFLLRAKFLKKFERSKDGEVVNNFLNVRGTGTIRNGKVYFKATYWDSDDIRNFTDGETVEVLEAKKGKVLIRHL